MDVPPIADAAPEPVFPPLHQPPSPVSGGERRLADLEAALVEMNERLDALGVSLEASLREAVTQEVQAVAGELRHTVAELGRLLVRDLGKLSKLLSEHRDAIVAELGGAAPSTLPGASAARPSPAAATDDDGGAPPPTAGGVFDDESVPPEAEVKGEAPGDGVDGPGDGVEAGERQRRSLLRRRQS